MGLVRYRLSDHFASCMTPTVQNSSLALKYTYSASSVGLAVHLSSVALSDLDAPISC